MNYDIIYVCKSTNNKNVRSGELNILRKLEDKLCFEFGKDEMNIKKRFYNDMKTLNEDFEALVTLKKSIEKNEKNMIDDEEELDEHIVDEPVIRRPVNVQSKHQSKSSRRRINFDD